MRESVSSDFQTRRRELKIWRAAEYFWRTSRCFEIGGNTLLMGGHILSIKTKTTEKQRYKILELYAN